MLFEFDGQLTAKIAAYGDKQLLGDLLRQYQLQLELAKTAMHPAAATHLEPAGPRS